MDELLARHRREQKELQNQITALKKQATKKTRKLVNSKCSDLQYSLDERHRKEIQELEGPTDELTPDMLLKLAISPDDTSSNPAGTELAKEPESSSAPATPTASTSTSGGRKRNRAKERLAKRNAEIEAIKQQAREEAENSIDYRQIELDSMGKILVHNRLSVHDIRPDGHCLFALVAHQLQQRHNTEVGVEELRKTAGEQIRQNKDDYLPFLFDPETMQLRDIDEYLKELEETAMWGSDMEIHALAQAYECPIRVFQAGAAPIVFNENGPNAELKVGFYRHSYGLGEHYNSLVDAP